MNRIVLVGVLAAVLSQYAWLFPVPRFYEVCAAVAAACALMGLILFTAERLRGRG